MTQTALEMTAFEIKMKQEEVEKLRAIQEDEAKIVDGLISTFKDGFSISIGYVSYNAIHINLKVKEIRDAAPILNYLSRVKKRVSTGIYSKTSGSIYYSYGVIDLSVCLKHDGEDTACRKVIVGYRKEKVPIYEVQCPGQEATIPPVKEEEHSHEVQCPGQTD